MEKSKSASRERIEKKRLDVTEAYSQALFNGKQIEPLIDLLAKRHKCTRDSIRKIITSWRKANEITD